MEFKHWPKIPRITNEVWEVTEKIDGTNGVIAIEEDKIGGLTIHVGSRNRWLSLENDNHGFMKWVLENTDEIVKLGTGYHYGEWYGQGIQRGYELKEKRFALFYLAKGAIKPDCCELISPLDLIVKDSEYGFIGKELASSISLSVRKLQTFGSLQVPGYMHPEGIIIRSRLTGQRYKYILEKDNKS